MIKASSERYRKKGMGIAAPVVTAYGLLTRGLFKKRPHILVACMPKSGSTYLTNLLVAYPGMKRRKLVPVYDDREQELCEYRLMLHSADAYVGQLHLKNNLWTDEMIRRYGLTPVVLVRNAYDCVASIRDHVLLEKDFGAVMAMPEGFADLSQDELDMAIIRLTMPWYLSFYVSWKKNKDALFVSYEELVQQPEQIARAVLEKAGVAVKDDDLKQALGTVSSTGNRFNKGISGRGATLSSDARKELQNIINLYPEHAHEAPFQFPSGT